MVSNKTKIIYFEDEWRELQEGVDRLAAFLNSGVDAKRPFTNAELSKLYSSVYTLCVERVFTDGSTCSTVLLYQRFKESVETYLKEEVVPSLREKKGESLMVEVVNTWETFRAFVDYMIKIFKYLDEYFTKYNGRDKLNLVCIKCYKTLVYKPIKQDLLAAFLEEGMGAGMDKDRMKAVDNIFIEMRSNRRSY